jgi:hypothetical protein
MNFSHKSTILGVALGLTLIGAEFVLSETIVYQFAGTVTSVDDPGGSLTGLVSAGTPYAGTFSFDTSLTDSLPGDSTVGFHQMSIPPGGFSIEMGGISFHSAPAQLGSVTVYDNNFGLRDRLQLQTQPASPDVSLLPNAGAIGLNLWDFTLAAFDSDSLSEALQVNFDDFQERSLHIQARDTATGMTFNIHSFNGLQSFEQVPEPSAAILIAFVASIVLGPTLRFNREHGAKSHSDNSISRSK